MTFESSLPSPEEVRAHNTMRMIRVRLTDLPYENVVTKLDCAFEGIEARMPMLLMLHEVDDHPVRGFLPSKVWWRKEDNDLHFLFYVQPNMPAEARPFGTGKSYIGATYIDPTCTVEYEVGLRVFIDQVQTDEGTLYVFMFGENEYDNVVASRTTIGDLEGVLLEEDCRYDNEIFNLYKDE